MEIYVGVGGQATPRAENFLREGGAGLPASVLSQSVTLARGGPEGHFSQKSWNLALFAPKSILGPKSDFLVIFYGKSDFLLPK